MARQLVPCGQHFIFCSPRPIYSTILHPSRDSDKANDWVQGWGGVRVQPGISLIAVRLDRSLGGESNPDYVPSSLPPPPFRSIPVYLMPYFISALLQSPLLDPGLFQIC